MLLKILRKTLAPFGMLLTIILILFMAKKRFPFMRDVPKSTLYIVVFAIIAVWLLVVLIKWLVERKKAAAIEDGILEQAQAGADSATPARRAEIEELTKNLTEALALLKKGPQGKKALYTLPWYMIIGPPAIGKTTVIKNSSLSFPGMTTAKLMRGTGGTRNCDWWFSADAILLDTAGRYADGADRSETEDEWFAFLDLLKTHRQKRPIDGLILAYSIEEIYELDEMDLINKARELRQRMDEILDRLGWTFPVYVLFTKCDLISGFTSYFSSLTPVDRYQVWGAVHEPSPEGDQQAGARFADAYDTLLGNLRTMRPNRMADVSRSEDWGRVFMFPEEFSNLKDKMVLMVETLFEANPYRKDVPIFRGTYFSSGMQQGKPFDQVASKIQTMLGGHADAQDVEFQEEKDDAYFVRDLFAKVLKGDQGLVRMTGATARKRMKLSVGLAAGAALLGVLACVWIGVSWGRLKHRMDETRNIAVEVQQQSSIGTPVEELRNLGALRERVDGSWASFPLLVKDGVHQAARRVYHDAVTERILKPVEERVAYLLGAPESLSGNEVRRALRTELMLLYPEQKDRIGWGAKELAAALYYYGLEDVREDEKAQAQLEATVEVFLDLETPIAGVDRERALIRGARRLGQTHAPHEFYRGIVAEASEEFDDVTLASLVPGESLLESSGSVLAAYTRSGWTTTVKPAIDDVLETVDADNDLIELAGGQPTERPPSQAELLNFYQGDYPDEWVEFVESIRVPTYPNARELEEDLKELRSERRSPLFELVQKMADVSNPAPPSLAEDAPVGETVAEIRLELQALHDLVGEDGAASEIYAGYFEMLKDVYRQVSNYVNEPGFVVEWGAVQDARLWVDDFEGDYDSSMASALKTLLDRPIDESERVLKRGIVAQNTSRLSNEWNGVRDQVGGEIRSAYPFTLTDKEADKDDVVRVFGAGGVLQNFESFLADNNYRAGARTQSALESAVEIRDDLLSAGPGIQTRFKLKTGNVRALEGSDEGHKNRRMIDQIVLTINGIELVDLLRNAEQSFTWSSEDPDQICTLSLGSTDPRRTVAEFERKDSTWSICRFFDAARVEPGPGNGHTVTWSFPDEGIEIDFTLTTVGGKQPFFLDESAFRRFTLPQRVKD